MMKEVRRGVRLKPTRLESSQEPLNPCTKLKKPGNLSFADMGPVVQN